MGTLFGSIFVDIGIAFILGILGGIAAELIDNSGKAAIPYLSDDKKMLSLGIFSKMIIGGIAASAFFFVIDVTDPLKFVGAMVAAGFGGSATLIAIKEKILSGKRQELERDLSDASTKAIEEARKYVARPSPDQEILNAIEKKVNDAKKQLDNLGKSPAN